MEEIDALAQGEETTFFENRYRHRDGTYRWLRWSARPVPGRQTIYATARDVTRQKRLEKEILEILDRERERLGRELHDGLCQNLAGIAALTASLSKRLLASSEPATAAAAAEIGELLKGTIEEARNLARGLGPMGLDELGLEGVLEALAVNVRHLFGVSCSFDSDGPVDGLGREAESHLFRIAQEAVNNGISHGKAGHIEIELSAKQGEGRLCVEDDGVGLPEAEGNPEGIGMHTMAYRARLIGGSLEVRRRDRGGTRVTCVFSLPERS